METQEEGQYQPQIAPKRRKSRKVAEKVQDDRISALSDCLLLEILSRLPSTKEAIRTGAISKRWKPLWTLVPTLIFKHDFSHLWFDFVLCVDKALTQCRQLKLKNFQVYTSYYSRVVGFEQQINNWIRFALRCNVEDLNIRLPGLEAKFLLDQIFFINTCFTDLKLQGCIVNPIGAISWKNLRSLCISSGILDEDVIENILSGSPLLETLVLQLCCGFRRIDITSKSIKKFVFSGYIVFDNPLGAHIIEINAPNILSLTIRDYNKAGNGGASTSRNGRRDA
ncbi:hypothetical protein Lser_V15G32377 [Lactuca serriola]